MREPWAQSRFLLPSLCFSSVVWGQEGLLPHLRSPYTLRVLYNHGEQGGVGEGPCCRLQPGCVLRTAGMVKKVAARTAKTTSFTGSPQGVFEWDSRLL